MSLTQPVVFSYYRNIYNIPFGCLWAFLTSARTYREIRYFLRLLLWDLLSHSPGNFRQELTLYRELIPVKGDYYDTDS